MQLCVVIIASNVTVTTKVKFVVTIAHRPPVYSVTISGATRPSNKENDHSASPHYHTSLKGTKVQHSREYKRVRLPIVKGSIAGLPAVATKHLLKLIIVEGLSPS